MALEIISELRYPLYAEAEASGKNGQGLSEGEDAKSDGDSSDEDVRDRSTPSDEDKLRSAVEQRLLEVNKQLAALDSKQTKKRTAEAKRMDEELRSTLENDKVKFEEVLAKLMQQINQKDEAESKIWCQSLDVALFLLQNTNKVCVVSLDLYPKLTYA